MSGLLDDVRRTFEARMAAHEGMLHHLGLVPSEEDAPLLFHELRGSLLACGSCHCPNACLEWQSSGEDGPPPWCHRSGAFQVLRDACDALDAEHGQTAAVG